MPNPTTFTEFEKWMLNDGYVGTKGGSIFAECRKQFRVSQQDLANRARVERTTISNIESGGIRNRLRKTTITNILEAFGDLYDENEGQIDTLHLKLPIPTRREIREIAAYLFEDIKKEQKWYLFYLTRRPDKTHLVKSVIAITPQGRCTLEYADDELIYKGVIHLESPRRLLVILDSKSEVMTERMVFRFDAPYEEHITRLNGTWLGIDGAEHQVASNVIMAHEDLCRRMGEDYIRSELRKLDNVWITENNPDLSGEEASMASHWNRLELVKEIDNLQPGDEIDFSSTYFSEFRPIMNSIKHLGHKLKQTGSNKPVKARVLMLHPDCEAVLNARFMNLPVEEPSNGIRRQARALLTLNALLSGTIQISVRFYKCWPMGHLFRFPRITYLGMYLPYSLACEGPMITVEQPSSHLWQMFQDNFDAVYQEAQDASEYLGKID